MSSPAQQGGKPPAANAPQPADAPQPPSAEQLASRGGRAPVLPGCLYVVGTPIGNLEDMSYRAVRVLGEVELVAAEDTRSARVLLDHFGIRTPTVSFFKGNEARRGERVLERLRQGGSVALISEAGLPGISDPGESLIARCLSEGMAVDLIPGPNAALAALVLSGLPSSGFLFLGFLPRKGKERRRQLQLLCEQPLTAILYEAPGRVADTLNELRQLLGDRPAAVARELTKLHQEVVRGTLGELAERFGQAPPRGEVTLVVGGGQDELAVNEEELAAEVQGRLAAGQGPRAIAVALAAHGKRRVYQLALRLSEG